ncbi:hypothetical protein PANI_CDS0007 [Maribacter phage Panino]
MTYTFESKTYCFFFSLNGHGSATLLRFSFPRTMYP